jgi:hypothetical protein
VLLIIQDSPKVFKKIFLNDTHRTEVINTKLKNLCCDFALNADY